MKIDIELMSKVIDYNKERFYAYKNGIILEKNLDYERILSARYMKVSRVKKRLFYLIYNFKYIWFCTFTFNDYFINKSDRTKRDLIKRCINYLDFKYILNIDYGKTTEREHYHCLIGTNWNLNINTYLKDNYPCFSSALLCNTNKEDLTRLTKYINKLSNHCIKATTNRQRILYNFKGFEKLAPDSRSSNLAYNLILEDFKNVSRT